jgi:hypothetical protein
MEFESRDSRRRAAATADFAGGDECAGADPGAGGGVCTHLPLEDSHSNESGSGVGHEAAAARGTASQAGARSGVGVGLAVSGAGRQAAQAEAPRERTNERSATARLSTTGVSTSQRRLERGS